MAIRHGSTRRPRLPESTNAGLMLIYMKHVIKPALLSRTSKPQTHITPRAQPLFTIMSSDSGNLSWAGEDSGALSARREDRHVSAILGLKQVNSGRALHLTMTRQVAGDNSIMTGQVAEDEELGNLETEAMTIF